MRQAQHDSRAFAQLDFQLHESIWRLSRNETLRRHLTLLTLPLLPWARSPAPPAPPTANSATTSA